jgi:hypothetical protein
VKDQSIPTAAIPELLIVIPAAIAKEMRASTVGAVFVRVLGFSEEYLHQAKL